MMTYSQRKELRTQLLHELYNYYFEFGRSKKMALRELNDEIEKKFAYQYLSDKGLISMHNVNGTLYQFKITAEGIDYVEGSPLME